MSVLVLGASGLLGGELCRQALAAGMPVAGTFLRAPGPIGGVAWLGLDLRDRAAVQVAMEKVRPSIVVNAAYARADWAATADGAAHAALACADVGARLVHVSSDVVHSGRPEPYGDDEPPTPISSYGAAKAAAETAVRAVLPTAVVARTSLILGDEHSEQVALCLDMITRRRSGELFSDEYRCPIGVTDLAAALLELAATNVAGLLNVAGPQALSRAELGRLVAERYGLDPGRVPVGTLAGAGLVRPANVRLDVGVATTLLRTRLRPAAEVLAPV